MKGNWWFLIVAAAAVLGIVTFAMGARIFRWEAVTWEAALIVVSLLGYWYSRAVQR